MCGVFPFLLLKLSTPALLALFTSLTTSDRMPLKELLLLSGEGSVCHLSSSVTGHQTPDLRDLEPIQPLEALRRPGDGIANGLLNRLL